MYNWKPFSSKSSCKRDYRVEARFMNNLKFIHMHNSIFVYNKKKKKVNKHVVAQSTPSWYPPAPLGHSIYTHVGKRGSTVTWTEEVGKITCSTGQLSTGAGRT
jgi:hypothetical protein